MCAQPIKHRCRAMRGSCNSIPTFTSQSRDTATNAARPNTTWRWHQSRRCGEECAHPGWSRRRSHQNHQLRQGKAVLHRVERKLLAAKPPRPLRVRKISVEEEDGRRARPCSPADRGRLVVFLILGGAALQRCGNRIVTRPALAAEGNGRASIVLPTPASTPVVGR